MRSSTDARKAVRTEMMKHGYKATWSTLCDRIGSRTIVEDIGIAVLEQLLVANHQDVDAVCSAINKASAADVAHLAGHSGDTGLVRGIAALRLPTDPEIDRYYANYLRDRAAAGALPAYSANLYDNFRRDMRAGSGQYWDFAAAAFRPMSEAFRDLHTQGAVAVDPAVFCNNVFAGQNPNLALHTLGAVPGWVFNRDLATGYELSTFLAGVPAGFSRQFDAPMRRAIAHVAATLNSQLPAQTIINLGVTVGPRLSTLLETVRDSPTPANVLTALRLVLVPPAGAPVAAGFPLALGHMDELAAAAPRLAPLTANKPFGNRAGGLRGHFIKHPLGVQAPAHAATALWEAQQWGGLLNLFPNGLVRRGPMAALARYSRNEWSIFAQHAHSYWSYYSWNYNSVDAASRPTNAAEVQALIGYLQAAGAAGADAIALATAHENVYQAYVAGQFDIAAPNRFLYYDAGALKINAMIGNLFMVAAWNGADFDLSTGFLVNGGAAAQYNVALPQRMMNL